METWKQFLNCYVKLIFEDGENHFSKKVGDVLEINHTHIVLLINGRHEAINLSKVLRIEEVKE